MSAHGTSPLLALAVCSASLAAINGLPRSPIVSPPPPREVEELQDHGVRPDPRTIVNALSSSRVVVPKEDSARLDSDAGGRSSRLNGSHDGYGSGGSAYGYVIKLQPGFVSRSVEE